MLGWLDRIAWGILALLHLMPALALFRPSLIEALYGVEPTDPSFLLLHHRAALFAVILMLCIWAAVDADVRRVAAVATGLSMISFLYLYWANGMPLAFRSIALADLIGAPVLLFAAWRAFAAA